MKRISERLMERPVEQVHSEVKPVVEQRHDSVVEQLPDLPSAPPRLERNEQLTSTLLRSRVEGRLDEALTSIEDRGEVARKIDEQLASLPRAEQVQVLARDVHEMMAENPPTSGMTWSELYSKGPEYVARFYQDHPEALKTAMMVGGVMITLFSGGTAAGVMGSALRYASLGDAVFTPGKEMTEDQRAYDQALSNILKFGAVGVGLAASGPAAAAVLGVSLFGEHLLPTHWKTIASATLSGPTSLGKWLQEVGKVAGLRGLGEGVKTGISKGSAWVMPYLQAAAKKGVRQTAYDAASGLGQKSVDLAKAGGSKAWSGVKSLYGWATSKKGGASETGAPTAVLPKKEEAVSSSSAPQKDVIGMLSSAGLTASDMMVRYLVASGQISPTDALELQAKTRLAAKTVGLKPDGGAESARLSRMATGARLVTVAATEGMSGLGHQLASEATWHLPGLQRILQMTTPDLVSQNQGVMTKALEMGSEMEFLNALRGVPDLAKAGKDIYDLYQSSRLDPLKEQAYRALAERFGALSAQEPVGG